MRLVLGVIAEEHVTDSVAESLLRIPTRGLIAFTAPWLPGAPTALPSYADARQRSTACRDLRLIPVWRSPA